MIDTVPAWKRNVIALATGIVMKPKTKKWIITAAILGAWKAEAEEFGLFPVDAENEYAAAHNGALAIARLIYGKDATVGFIATHDAPRYLASIGTYVQADYGLALKGRTLRVSVEAYGGSQ